MPVALARWFSSTPRASAQSVASKPWLKNYWPNGRARFFSGATITRSVSSRKPTLTLRMYSSISDHSITLLMPVQQGRQACPDAGGSCCRRRAHAREAPSSSRQSCSSRPYPSQLHHCSSTDSRARESVCPASGCQRRGPFPQDAGPSKCGAESISSLIRVCALSPLMSGLRPSSLLDSIFLFLFCSRDLWRSGMVGIFHIGEWACTLTLRASGSF